MRLEEGKQGKIKNECTERREPVLALDLGGNDEEKTNPYC